MTKSITIEEFKAQCLTLLDEVATTGEPVVITRDGVPVAELSPPKHPPAPQPREPKTLFGAMKGQIEIKGDIISPIYAEWADAVNISETNEPAAISEESNVASDPPTESGKPKSLYGLMKGRIRSTGDIVSPLDEQWDALK